MAVNIVKNAEWILELEQFLEKVRPPEEIRDKLDIGYKIINQSVIIHEIRPLWTNQKQKIEPEVAKATYIKNKNHWKVFWLRSNLKWYIYEANPIVNELSDFLKIVEEDSHGCFWG